ncbi:MAG: alpha/beta hydrolase [Bacteroidales bacterium]|nr:alpha/beta hydrolase [Bacteroidales bacterium]
MKHYLLSTLAAVLMTPGVFAQEPVPTNRYAMKLEQKPDGSYALQREQRYAKIINLSEIPDLYTPYVHENKRLSGKLYNKARTKDYIYKIHDGYELHIEIDSFDSSSPTPVMFYVHGGGWARGTNTSSRSISKYLAQQHGITGVRIQYTLAPQPGANVQVSIQDVLDAVEYVREHASELNVDMTRIGFLGTSAGGHLAAVAALKCNAKVFVGYSGIYDLTTAAITTRAKDPERIAYFGGLKSDYLKEASPYFMIPKKTSLAAQLFCGTADLTVECVQSEEFAAALKRRKAKVDLQEYMYYDHNLSSKTSDKMEEIFFKTADFVSKNL